MDFNAKERYVIELDTKLSAIEQVLFRAFAHRVLQGDVSFYQNSSKRSILALHHSEDATLVTVSNLLEEFMPILKDFRDEQKRIDSSLRYTTQRDDFAHFTNTQDLLWTLRGPTA